MASPGNSWVMTDEQVAPITFPASSPNFQHAEQTCQRLLSHYHTLQEQVARLEAAQRPLGDMLQQQHERIQKLEAENARLRGQLGNVKRDRPQQPKKEAWAEQFPPPGHSAPSSPEDALFVTAREGKESQRAKGGATPRLGNRETKRPDDAKPYEARKEGDDTRGRATREAGEATEVRKEAEARMSPMERTEGMKWLMEASPSIPSSALQAPRTLEPLPPSLASSTGDPEPATTYECVVPRVLYQDKRVENALNLFYSFLHGNGVPIKLQQSPKMSLAMAQIPLLPVIISSTLSLTKDIQMAYDKAEIPNGLKPIVLAFIFIAQHELNKRRSRLQSIEPVSTCRAIVPFAYFNKDFYDCECNNTGITELMALLRSSSSTPQA